METKDFFFKAIQEKMLTFDMQATEQMIRKGLEAGINPVEIVENGLTPGIEKIGDRFGRGEAYLPELMQAAQIMKAGVKILEPMIKASKSMSEKSVTRILLGTVQGDIHDIGKNIVRIVLETAGFEVIDLGVDVSVDKFVQAVKEVRPAVIGLSALLTTTLSLMGRVIASLEHHGLRKSVKVIVGGSSVSQEYADSIRADAYGIDAIDGLSKIKTLIS